jgi:signal transduction histidine kinase
MGSLARRVQVANDAERKRLERALHDGAQQRLVAATTTLGLALKKLHAGDPCAEQLVEEASAELQRCVEDLRDLARDIYPAVLAERGLAGALHDLAKQAPGPVEFGELPETRFPENVELAAYLVAADALSGLAADGLAEVVATAHDGELTMEIRGARLDGEQLERLGERVQALAGRLEVTPEPSVRASLPTN